MRIYLTVLMICAALYTRAQLTVTEVSTLPDPVSNNAVCEGFVNGVPYLYSFGGIDETKLFSGIHLNSYRYNILTEQSEQIADLPDDMGKIACAASRIGNIIYITGGYTVLANGNEISSEKVHRYDIENNVFLADAATLLRSTDDHVQGVWRDSLLYVVTGWSDNGNIRNVQIYDPNLDTWSNGTPLPGNTNFTSFGASGTIIGDTIFYYGGAADSQGFVIQNQLRKGIIDPDNPTQIAWSFSILDEDVTGYRMAATTVGKELHWIGGSEVTYNFDGIAYNGSGGVSPSSRDLFLISGEENWNSINNIEVPMDLRGIANLSDTVQYIAGGMLENQQVTNKIYKLEWERDFGSHNNELSINDNISVYPNPVKDFLQLELKDSQDKINDLQIMNSTGEFIQKFSLGPAAYEVDLSSLKTGVYYLFWKDKIRSYTYPFIKL